MGILLASTWRDQLLQIGILLVYGLK
jgi:hypothetical protein